MSEDRTVDVTPMEARAVACRILALEIRHNPADWESWPYFSSDAWSAIDLAALTIADELMAQCLRFELEHDIDGQQILRAAS